MSAQAPSKFAKVTLFKDSLEATMSRLNLEQKGEILECILAYLSGERYNPTSEIVAAKFDVLEAQFKREIETRENISKMRREIGSLGGKAKSENNKSQTKEEFVTTERTDIEVLPIIAEEVVVENPEPKPKTVGLNPPPGGHATIKGKEVYRRHDGTIFVAPTIEEVEDLIKERGYHFDAKTFIDYYAADDWRYGKKRENVKVWKRCASTFESTYISNQGRIALAGQRQTSRVHDNINNIEYGSF